MEIIKEHLRTVSRDGQELVADSVTLSKWDDKQYATHRTETRVDLEGNVRKSHFWGHYCPNLHEAELDFIRRCKS